MPTSRHIGITDVIEKTVLDNFSDRCWPADGKQPRQTTVCRTSGRCDRNLVPLWEERFVFDLVCRSEQFYSKDMRTRINAAHKRGTVFSLTLALLAGIFSFTKGFGAVGDGLMPDRARTRPGGSGRRSDGGSQPGDDSRPAGTPPADARSRSDDDSKPAGTSVPGQADWRCPCRL